MRINLVLWIAGVNLALSATFFYLFYIRFYAWKDCFNELGRCYDPDGSEQVYTTGGMVWSLPAFLFLLIAVLSFCTVWLKPRSGGRPKRAKRADRVASGLR